MRNRFEIKCDSVTSGLPAGNLKFHNNRCMCCNKMENGKTSLVSSKTKREFKVKIHYTCQSTYCVYVLTCKLCSAQYTGQTTQSVQKRHYGHRGDVKRGDEDMGLHFYNHALELGIVINSKLDDILDPPLLDLSQYLLLNCFSILPLLISAVVLYNFLPPARSWKISL